jgi:hypothetical protein
LTAGDLVRRSVSAHDTAAGLACPITAALHLADQINIETMGGAERQDASLEPPASRTVIIGRKVRLPRHAVRSGKKRFEQGHRSSPGQLSAAINAII